MKFRARFWSILMKRFRIEVSELKMFRSIHLRHWSVHLDRYKSRKIIYSRPRKLVLIYFGFHQTVNEALVTPFRFINTGYGLQNDRFTSDLPQFVPIINCHNNEWFMSHISDNVWPSFTASDLDLTSDLWSRQMTQAHSEWIGLKSEKKSKYTPGDNAKTRQVIRNSRSPISLNFVSRTIAKSKMTDKSCIKLPVDLRTKITEINWSYAVIFSQNR